MTLPFCVDYIDTFISKMILHRQNGYKLHTIQIDCKDIIVLKMIEKSSLLNYFLTIQSQLTLSQALNWFTEEYPNMTFGLMKVNRIYILIGLDVKNFNTSTNILVPIYYVTYGQAYVLTLTRDTKTIKDIMSKVISDLLSNIDEPYIHAYRNLINL